MYEQFGATEVGATSQARFRVFIPDAALDPAQYQRGGASTIASIQVFGDFQAALGGINWTADPALTLARSQFVDSGRTKGYLYELTTAPLPEGFYQYKLIVTFASGAEPRIVCDPCTRYGGKDNQNSAFVIGGPKCDTVPLANPMSPAQLMIYEVMIDDFTQTFRGPRAPLGALTDKLDYVQSLGVNAIELMPWTQWAGHDYDWGYTPQSYFAIAYRYTDNPNNPAEKLFLLKKLISACHQRGLHVIFDGVFDHVTGSGPDCGFGYEWLWEDPAESPYRGKFATADFGKDLDYHNGCVLDFVIDVCCYWIDVFRIDGIRFDESSGFYDPEQLNRGLPALIARLRVALDKRGLNRFPLFIEHTWGYESVHIANSVNATGCWLDPFRVRSRDYLSARQIEPPIMRLLDAGRDVAGTGRPVTYIENHDHESIALNAGTRNEWWRTQPYAIALLTAAGVPLIHNGQEYAELYPMPEFGAERPGASEDPVAQRVVARPLRFTIGDEPGAAALALYRRLLAIRANHLGLTSLNFHPTGWSESMMQPDADGFGIDRARQTVVYHRWGTGANGRMEKFYVVLNFSRCDQTVSVTFPEDDGWVDLLSDWQPAVTNGRLTFQVGSSWGHIFYKQY